jgi:ribosomal protein S6--L-glutamate ligase
MLRLVTFNPYRSLGIPGVVYIKPEHLFRERDRLAEADWVLFPEYWQLNPLVYGIGARIYPSQSSYLMGHNKVEMTRVLMSVAPEHVPQTEILPSTPSALEQVLDTFSFPFVAKTIKSSMGQGVFLIESRGQLRDYAAVHDILYVQEYLPATRDLRVVMVGDSVLTAYWRVSDSGAFHHNVAMGGRIDFADVPDMPLQLVERVSRKLGIDHAGYDLIEVGGHWYFLELNVMFGNQAISDAGIPLAARIHQYLVSRHNTPPRNVPELPLAM